ncbi:hypothetical protein [Kiloniella antarctica]|uniref:Poly(3-hydroxyalkanoate) polymerase subunit PhaE n=1 Tax=Kiloniella antarctica TaxID=1550907 RepID=A0ABW5BEC4_9PROT
MNQDENIKALAEGYLELWVKYVSEQSLMPWDIPDNKSPELEGLYRQWEAFYHKTLDPNQAFEGFVPTTHQKGTARSDDDEDQSQSQPCSAPVSRNVSSDELAELQVRLGLLAQQISELEINARDPGSDDAGNNG